MKKILLVTLFSFCVAIITNAQVYIKPTYGAKSLKEVEITKIEITNKYTIVHFYFDSKDKYPYGGWIALSKNMYIKNAKTHKKHYLIKSSNIPLMPKRLDFTGRYKRKFKAYFPPINPATEMIHIIEETENGFNFYKIKLKPIAYFKHEEIENWC
ncbi:MAG: hypothetical protein AB8G11_20570 [Saprospiraceae bacterium]